MRLSKLRSECLPSKNDAMKVITAMMISCHPNLRFFNQQSQPYQNDNYGHEASKWFKKFRMECGIDSPQLVFHSFRHTLSDNLKQQLITETLIDELTGHALQGETMGRYGKRYKSEVLYNEAVLKLDYGIILDHLKNSKHTKL